jgi:Phosphotransferase enzyme family
MDDSSPTVATLSSWLRRSGSLPSGDVSEVNIDLEYPTPISKLFFLTATYTSDAPSDLPRHIVVKSPRVQASGDGPEVQFYRDVAPILATPPVVRCLAAIENSDGQPETIVIEDLRATHDHRPWPVPPTKSQSDLAIDALAHVHAQYWEAPTLGNTIGRHNTEQDLTNMVQGVAAHLPAFFDEFGDSLAADVRKVYERVFASSLKPWLRLTDPRALTIIHGDAHSWNFLFPRSGSGPAYLLDWQLWHIDVGARDLAFLIALHWYPGRRHDLEKPLIGRYHEALLAHGIANYTLDDLWLDYRRGVIRNLTIPIIWWSRGMNVEVWWHSVECALAAYHDLECDELL